MPSQAVKIERLTGAAGVSEKSALRRRFAAIRIARAIVGVDSRYGFGLFVTEW